MANISNLIEEFILENLTDGILEISRNDLADYFSVAPSQINYVLSTRFTPLKGYIIESQRGGGGFIKLTQIDMNKNDYIKKLITKHIPDEISYSDSCSILNELYKRKFITLREQQIIKTAVSPKSLNSPIKIEDKLRSNILKNVILEILKGENL